MKRKLIPYLRPRPEKCHPMEEKNKRERKVAG